MYMPFFDGVVRKFITGFMLLSGYVLGHGGEWLKKKSYVETDPSDRSSSSYTKNCMSSTRLNYSCLITDIMSLFFFM